jgi:hypothetical protein
MGKKITHDIDWSLDRGNEAGDIVMITQHTRTELGVVSFPGQAPFYDYYAKIVNEAYAQSQSLHQRVLELPVDESSKMRHMFASDLLSSIYSYGSQLIVNLYLMFEHFALYAGITVFRRASPAHYDEFENMELKDKLKDLFKEFQVSELTKSPGFGVLFSDVERVRHAINHPKGDNLYSVDESKWDNVPIAWFVSGKHLEATAKCIELYNKVHDVYTSYVATHKQPGKITLEGPIVNRDYYAPKNVGNHRSKRK